jgi:hypothetical protein
VSVQAAGGVPARGRGAAGARARRALWPLGAVTGVAALLLVVGDGITTDATSPLRISEAYSAPTAWRGELRRARRSRRLDGGSRTSAATAWKERRGTTGVAPRRSCAYGHEGPPPTNRAANAAAAATSANFVRVFTGLSLLSGHSGTAQAWASSEDTSPSGRVTSVVARTATSHVASG